MVRPHQGNGRCVRWLNEVSEAPNKGTNVITLERFRDQRTGEPLAGFFIRNKRGKVLAIGSHAPGRAFVIMKAKRYEHDLDLCRAIRRWTGLWPRGVLIDDRALTRRVGR
jgi:hypothetical protein